MININPYAYNEDNFWIFQAFTPMNDACIKFRWGNCKKGSIDKSGLGTLVICILIIGGIFYERIKLLKHLKLY